MAGRGGKREGAGRKSISEEVNSREIAVAALVERFGSKQAAFKYLITTGEPSLVKFVFEHAFGKPAQSLELSGGLKLGKDIDEIIYE